MCFLFIGLFVFSLLNRLGQDKETITSWMKRRGLDFCFSGLSSPSIPSNKEVAASLSLGRMSETPTTTSQKKTAILPVPLRPEERVLLPFVSRCTSHLYRNAPPICIAILWKMLGSPEWMLPNFSGTKNQPKEEALGRISLRTSGQRLRSGPPNPARISILARTSRADVHEKTSVCKTSGWFFAPQFWIRNLVAARCHCERLRYLCDSPPRPAPKSATPSRRQLISVIFWYEEEDRERANRALVIVL